MTARPFRSPITFLAVALGAVATAIVVGIVTGSAIVVFAAALAALAIWPILQGLERRVAERSRPTGPPFEPVEGEARLLFVDMDERTRRKRPARGEAPSTVPL